MTPKGHQNPLINIAKFSVGRAPGSPLNSPLIYIWSISLTKGAGHSSMVECPLTMVWVVELIPFGGPIKLCFVPATAPQLVRQMSWYILSCLYDGAYT